MAVSDGDEITVVKEQGLVSNVFDDRTLAPLTGHLAIGHTRYSTTGSSTWRNAQPVYRGVGDTPSSRSATTATSSTPRRSPPTPACCRARSTCDSDLVAELLAAELADDGRRAQRRSRRRAGAAAPCCPGSKVRSRFVLADEGQVIGVRDPNGFRPLCLGSLENGWVLASETPALDIVGAHFVRELEPGEMVVIDADRRSLRAPVPGRARSTRSCACSSSSTSPGPTAGCTAAACTPPASAWASCSRSRRPSRPTW